MDRQDSEQGSEGEEVTMPTRMLKIGKAAVYLNVHPNTLRHWDDLIPHCRLGIGRNRHYLKKDLDAYLAECAVTHRMRTHDQPLP